MEGALTRHADGPALIGIDVGTSSVRSIAFDPRGRRIAAAARPTPTRIVDTGGEYHPEAIFAAVLATLSEIGVALAGRPVAGVAVASFGESCVLIDATGRPLAPSIVWHDRRTEQQARAIENAVGRDRVFEVIGHSVEPIYTLTKLMWMREHWPDAFVKARRVLMMADWIAFRCPVRRRPTRRSPRARSTTTSVRVAGRRRCWRSPASRRTFLPRVPLPGRRSARC